MKTIEQVVNEYKFTAFDERDIQRFSKFIPVEHFGKFELELGPVPVDHFHIELTREIILDHLKCDLKLAFDYALDNWDLSANAMFHVIKMWNWILEEGLEEWDNKDYSWHGLPFYKATALKYGFDNPIGDDIGNESKYGD